MKKLKKLPEIISSIALIFFLIYGIISSVDTNKLAVGIIIIGIAFYCIGFVIKAIIISTLTQEENKSDNNSSNVVVDELKTADSIKNGTPVGKDDDFEEMDINNIKHIDDRNKA